MLFFPLVTVLYFVLPQNWRTGMLLLASCIFYMSWIPQYILILFLIIGIDFYAAQRIEDSSGAQRKLYLLMSLVANLGLLAVFKYYDFFLDNILALAQHLGLSYIKPALNLILPIGLSFHTFQALAYTIEVYRGKQAAEKNLAVYSLYVLFYPQLVAGPIERPQNLIHQLKDKHEFNYDNVMFGLQLMLWGFFKKMVIADRVVPLVNTVYDNPHNYSGWPVLLATYLFAVEIYCDFSGYTDIAIGAAQVMGIHLMKNFNCPYAASSIREFWQRWHISLSTWFRDYLYIPLGGNRVSAMRMSFNLMVVFILSGLWHGANWTYIAWGFVHGSALILYLWWTKIFSRKTASTIVSSSDAANVAADAGEENSKPAPTEISEKATPALTASNEKAQPEPNVSKENAMPAPTAINENETPTSNAGALQWMKQALCVFITFHAVVLAWIFFRANNLSDAFYLVEHVFPLSGFEKIFDLGMSKAELAVAAGAILVLECIQFVQRRISVRKYVAELPLTVRWPIYYTAIFVVVIFAKYSSQRFIYFQF